MDYLLSVTKNSRQSRLKGSKVFQQKRTLIAQRRHKCDFCPKLDSSYTCSQCDKHYCSSTCFSSESHRECSEHFFKKCVFEQLKSDRIDDDERQKFVQMLKRNANQNPDILELLNTVDAKENNDEDDQTTNFDMDIIKDTELLQFSEQLIEKLNEMNIEDEGDLDHLWDKLSPEEQIHFIGLVNGNKKLFDKMIEEWIPWWRDEDWIRPVEEIRESSKESYESSKESKFPILYTSIDSISKLTSQTPSPSILYSIICVSFAYASLVKLHNGEIVVTSMDSNKDSDKNTVNDGNSATDKKTVIKDKKTNIWTFDLVKTLLENAPILAKDSTLVFSDCNQVIQFCISQTLSSGNVVKSDDKIRAIEILSDIEQIFHMKNTNVMTIREPGTGKCLRLPKNALYLLSDLIHILQNILKFDKNLTKGQAKTVELVRRKVHFYLCWVFDFGDEMFAKIEKSLCNTIQIVSEQLKQEIALFEREHFVETVPSK